MRLTFILEEQGDKAAMVKKRQLDGISLDRIEEVHLWVYQVSKATYCHRQKKLTVGFYNQSLEREDNSV